MNHTFNSDDVRQLFSGKSRPPLRTVKEMAKEFGVSVRQLAAFLGHSSTAPKPVFRQNGRANLTWYVHAEMRAWWKARGTE